MNTETTIEPVRRSVEVQCGPADAFRLFTDEIDSWWPLATHSVGEAESVSCHFEGRDGGRIFETQKDGYHARVGHDHGLGALGPGGLLVASGTRRHHRAGGRVAVHRHQKWHPCRTRTPWLGASRRPRGRDPSELRNRYGFRCSKPTSNGVPRQGENGTRPATCPPAARLKVGQGPPYFGPRLTSAW